jgi:hypothetical protein
MLRVVVNVKREGETKGRDLEVPAEESLERWLPHLVSSLDWPRSTGADFGYRVWVASLNRYLKLQEKLAEAGVWDGAELLFVPVVPQPCDFFLESSSGKRYPLRSRTVILGRRRREVSQQQAEEENTIPLREESALFQSQEEQAFIDLEREPKGNTVSRIHAQLCFDAGCWTFTLNDKAKNKTYLNQDLLVAGESRSVAPGDCLRLGGVTLWLRRSDAEADEPVSQEPGISPLELETAKAPSIDVDVPSILEQDDITVPGTTMAKDEK